MVPNNLADISNKKSKKKGMMGRYPHQDLFVWLHGLWPTGRIQRMNLRREAKRRSHQSPPPVSSQHPWSFAGNLLDLVQRVTTMHSHISEFCVRLILISNWAGLPDVEIILRTVTERERSIDVRMEHLMWTDELRKLEKS
jgi:hypothetical protein